MPAMKPPVGFDYSLREAASFNKALDRMRGSAVRRIAQSNVMGALPLIGQLGRSV